MPAIHWKPEVNALTVPQSYKMRFVPNSNLGTDDIAAGMTAINPALTPELAKASIAALIQTLQQGVINGNHINLDDSLIITISLAGRLDSPDDAPPPVTETVNVRINPTAKFMKEIYATATLAKEGMSKKLPLINTVTDTLLKLPNVINIDSVLRITGEDILFDAEQGTGECVLAGTVSGRSVQTRLNLVTNNTIMLMPELPAQAHPWNNEYLLSVTTRYTAHGTPRTGIYDQRLRSVVLVNGLMHPSGLGILSSGEANLPYVTLISGAASVSEIVRIQAVFDNRDSVLRLNLISMNEDGPVGEAVTITVNGSCTLQGFDGSAISNITINVADYLSLTELVRNYYYGRLVDVLDVRIS
jgi:hypothetical protein